jgi:sugar (pentulose or hexulose) kinase
MQLWNDSRPLRILPAIAAQRPPSYWHRLALLGGPGAGLARLTHLRDHAPGAWDDAALYGGAGECLCFHLTDRWRQDVGNALQIGCYDVPSDRLTGEPLSLVDAGLENVAPLRRGHETHPLTGAGARLLGCRSGIPVAGPYMDHEAGFLAGEASVGTDVLQCSLGTAWVGNFVHRSLPPPPGGMNLVLPAPVGRGRLVVRVLPAGNATLDWATSTLGGGRRRAERVLADSLLPPSHLVAMPWLTWPNPFGASGGGGGLLGVDTHTTRDDMLRASVASLCFAFRHVFEPVLARGGTGTVLLTGGASRSAPVRRLLAALLAPAVIRYSPSDELAGAGGSVWTFQEKAARLPCRTVRTSTRLSDQAADSYERFRSACTAVASGLGDAAGLPLTYYRRSTRT